MVSVTLGSSSSSTVTLSQVILPSLSLSFHICKMGNHPPFPQYTYTWKELNPAVGFFS